MSSLLLSSIQNFWVATGLSTTIVLFNQFNSIIGEYPLLNRQFLDDGLDVVEDLLTGADIEFDLMENVTYSRCAHFYNLALILCSPWNGLA